MISKHLHYCPFSLWVLTNFNKLTNTKAKDISCRFVLYFIVFMEHSFRVLFLLQFPSKPTNDSYTLWLYQPVIATVFPKKLQNLLRNKLKKELEVLTQTLNFPVSWEIPPTIHSTQCVCKRCAGMPLLGLCSWWRVRDQCKLGGFQSCYKNKELDLFLCFHLPSVDVTRIYH